MEFEVKHDLDSQKFFVLVDGKEAYLRYIVGNDNTINMIKTYVPPELRNKGIAAAVVLKGMQYARENNLNVIPTCSYVETFIHRHGEFEDLVKEF
jgi:predicted GNAT family acetyltransferase